MRAASCLAVSLVALALGGLGCDGKKSTDSPGDGAASTDAAGEDGLPWVDRGNGCMSVHTSAEEANTDRDVQMILSGNQAAIAFVPDAADMLVECGADEVTVSSESEMYMLSFTVITGENGAPETAGAIDIWIEGMAAQVPQMLGEGPWETAVIPGNNGKLILAIGQMKIESGETVFAAVAITARYMTDTQMVMAMHMQFSAEPWSAQETKDVAAEVAGLVDGFTFAPEQIWGEDWQQQAAP